MDNSTPVTEDELLTRSTGERVTLDAVNKAIVSEHYFTAADGVFGHAVTSQVGYSLRAHPDPANFDANIGRRIARENAVKEIWPLMGFELKCRLARKDQAPAQPSAASPAGAEEAILHVPV